MKFALHFANVTFPDALGAKRVALLAEQFGFEALICPEHVVLPQDYVSQYPYSATGRLPGDAHASYPDPLIWQAFVAGATTHIRFITGVLILPQRNPVVLAKEVATLDHLSGGRVSLGIGVGWLAEEFAAVGVPFARRGRRTDEYVAAMRALWRDDAASFAGEYVQFERVCCNPKPTHGSVPILVGGHTEFAARRAGRLGDGYFPATGSQNDVWPLVELARNTATESGRDPHQLEITMGCPELLPDLAGSIAGDGIGAVRALEAHGVQRIAVPLTPFVPDLERSLERLAEQVIRHVN